MDTVLDILHIAGAVFIVGPMAILPMTAMRAIRAGQAGPVRTLARSTNIFSLLSLLVVVFGFGAMSLSKYDTSVADTWIWLSIVLYVVALALVLFLVVPTMRRAADALDSAGVDQAAEAAVVADGAAAVSAAGGARSGYAAISAGSGVAAILLVAVVVLMVWKP